MYSISFDVAGLVLGGVNLAMMTMRKVYPTRKNRVFEICVVLNMVSALCNVITSLAISFNNELMMSFAFLSSFVHFFSIFVMAASFYIASCIRLGSRPVDKRDAIISAIYLVINVLLLCSCFFTRFYFYFDDSFVYHTSFLYYLSLLLMVGMMVYSMMRVSKDLRGKDTFKSVCLVVYVLVYVPLCLVNGFVKGLNVFHFGTAVLYILIYIVLNNPEDYVSGSYGCFNDMAFKDSLYYHSNLNKRMHVIGISFAETDFIRSTYPDLEIAQSFKSFVEFASARFGRFNFYTIGINQFVLELKGNNSLIESTMTEIKNYFVKPLSIGGVDFVVSPLFAVVEDNEKFDSIDNMYEVLTYCMSHTDLFKQRNVLRVTTEHMSMLSHEQELVLSVTRALKSGGVKVYYQPIYNVGKGIYTTCEALVRVFDEGLGFIPPDQFIPILERNGLIVELGDVILDQVCQDFVNYDFRSLGIERVEVNLSGAQVMVPGIYKKLLGTLRKYNVPSDAIVFEITESYNNKSGEGYFLDNISKLTVNGVKLALDDFGTGYSTLIYLIELPFEIIKIDKSLLNNAMSDVKSMVLLRNTVKMLSDLNKKIVVEGVETSEEAKLLKGLGVDFFQGYLYSKAICVTDFVEFVSPQGRSGK